VQHTNDVLYGATQECGTNGLGTILSLDVRLSPFVKTLPTAAPIKLSPAQVDALLAKGFV
jgi:hypothetical protein